MLSARVRHADGSFSPEFDHLLLRVALEESWIADVGFGDSSLDPVPIRPSTVQLDNAPQFAVLPANGGWELVRRQSDGCYVPDYRFTEVPRALSDFSERCRFHQTSSESHFTQKRVCTKALPNGRLTISGMRLIFTRNDQRQESVLKDEGEFRERLRQHFGIEFAGEVDWRKLTT
jgi:N-hydroxyarylamine O-acetyltransferase